MSANPEASASTQEAVAVPAEASAFLVENPTGVDYLSFDKNGDMLLPTKFRIDIPGVKHDFGRCTLAKNPKVTYDETHEVLDAEGNVVRTGEYVFEVIPHNKRSLHVGTIGDVDIPTMTKVEIDVFKNENRVMVVAAYATPIPRCATLPFRIDEIHYDIGLRKSSERRTGKVKPVAKAKKGTLGADSGDLDNGSHVGWVSTGEVFRLGNPKGPEVVIPESPQRADHMAAFADKFYDSPPSEAEVADFLADLD